MTLFIHSSLPASLVPFKELIEQSAIECVQLSLKEEPTSISESKLGGIPYIEKYSSIPLDSNGTPMQLLVQINFEQFKFSSVFPKQGLLQIFINQDFGNVNLPMENDTYYIKYIPVCTDQNHIGEEILIGEIPSYFPVQKTLKISGNVSMHPVSSLDYRYDSFYSSDKVKKVSEDERTFEEVYFETFLGAEHKIGGYPYFIENDFRVNNATAQTYNTLLFQIVTDDLYHINYRDSGIISFFINDEDLTKLNFNKIHMHVEQYE